MSETLEIGLVKKAPVHAGDAQKPQGALKELLCRRSEEEIHLGSQGRKGGSTPLAGMGQPPGRHQNTAPAQQQGTPAIWENQIGICLTLGSASGRQIPISLFWVANQVCQTLPLIMVLPY